MADENTKIEETKATETKEPWYAIKCECLKKFLIVSLGTFVGVYLALCLYGIQNKPPISDCAFKHPMMQQEFNVPNHQFGHCKHKHFKHKFKHHKLKRHNINKEQKEDKQNI